MSDITVEFYEGCIWCGVKKSEAISAWCYKDKAAVFLIESTSNPRHIWGGFFDGRRKQE